MFVNFALVVVFITVKIKIVSISVKASFSISFDFIVRVCAYDVEVFILVTRLKKFLLVVANYLPIRCPRKTAYD